MSFSDTSDRAGTAELPLLTAAQARERWQLWLAAEDALQFATSYTIGDRTLTRADLTDISRMVSYWARQYYALRAKERGAAATHYRVADFRYGPV